MQLVSRQSVQTVEHCLPYFWHVLFVVAQSFLHQQGVYGDQVDLVVLRDGFFKEKEVPCLSTWNGS